MKKTQIKDTLRNIGRQSVSFISVIVIALLGVAIFLGLDYSAAALARNGSVYLNAHNVRDVELISTLLFTPSDLDDIRSAEGVADAEAVWRVSAQASSGGDRREVSVVSLTERLNLPQLAEGRLPGNETECAVEQMLAEEMGWTIGSEILLQDAAGGAVQYLRGERFTMTGIVVHPDHNNTIVIDASYVLVTPGAFDREALDGCFMRAEIAMEKGADADRFSESYRADVASVRERLETLALSDTVRRDAGVHDQFQTQIDEKQRELDEAKDELAAARVELDEGWSRCAEGERELADAQTRLTESEAQLESARIKLDNAKVDLRRGKKELEAAKAQLDEGQAALEAAKAQLDEGKAELENGWGALENAKGQIRGAIRSAVENAVGMDSSGLIPWASSAGVNADRSDVSARSLTLASGVTVGLNRTLEEILDEFLASRAITDELLTAAYETLMGGPPDPALGYDLNAARAALVSRVASLGGAYASGYNDLVLACRQWDEGHEEYIQGLSLYNEKLAQFNQGLAAYQAGVEKYDSGQAEYRRGLARYNEGKEQYEQGLLDYEEGQKKLAESKRQLTEGEAAYTEALPRLADGEQQIAKAREQLAALAPCRWLILDLNGISGYVQLKLASENLRSLEGTFATLFLLVGALVIFATVSKMVDEQRALVGTTKALGFFNREIFAKYLSFGVSAALLGTILGILAARFGLEPFVVGAYNIYYTFRMSQAVITAIPTWITLLLTVALAAAAVWAACSRLLRTPAIRLMQARIPAGTKKTGTGERHALSLYSRLILLNMRADIRRVLVTVVSVAGCCALVVIGVTLKTAIKGSMDRQYHDVVKYDWRVNFNPGEADTAETEIEALLREAGTEYTPLFFTDVTYSVGDIQPAELFCGSAEAIEEYYRLDDWQSGEPLAATDEGILIQRRAAESYGLDVGSELEISIGGVKTAKLTVAGVFEHYFGRLMVISPACYEKAFGEDCRPNAFFVRLNGADETALAEALRTVKGFVSVTPSDSGREVFEASTSTVDSLVALFIFMAAVMAGVVLMNLTNIYVLQKKRELTIMRVNGFTVREVVGYMLRETVLTTLLGILAGIPLGSAISYRIVRAIETPLLQVVRSPSALAWIAGAALTVFFTVIVNVIALRPVRRLKLTDAT